MQPLESASTAHGRVALPNRIGSVKFAVIGDSGRGNRPQYDVAAQMTALRKQFPFAFALMNGDNIYEGPASPEDYREKFAKPYQQLLDDGVKLIRMPEVQCNARAELPYWKESCSVPGA